MTSRRIYRFGDADWHVPVARGTDPEQAAEAGGRGARRALLVVRTGEAALAETGQ